MSLSIVESCVNCYACEPLCPSEAIFMGEAIFMIDALKCTECDGDHDMPQCIDVCMEDDCIVFLD